MIKEYEFEGKIVFLLDADGDSFDSFQKSINYIKTSLQVELAENVAFEPAVPLNAKNPDYRNNRGL